MTEPTSVAPYRSTPVFDEHTLPQALRRDHRTKPGVWGVIRILSGRLKLVITETGETRLLDPGAPGLLLPEQLHFVEVVGPVCMQVDFHDKLPRLEEHFGSNRDSSRSDV
ncbi:MAG: DUF1971 domain-containing protein [Alphaproteobacteria bacterium]|nr:MAG: DUF1971 domain-containing protein [Alphaproteobacteria bacterium]